MDSVITRFVSEHQIMGFIYIIKSDNAGGVDEDRVSYEILQQHCIGIKLEERKLVRKSIVDRRNYAKNYFREIRM